MNLSIEDLEAIKALVREVVREELGRFERRQSVQNTAPQQTQASASSAPEQPQEVVARIPRV